MIARNQETLSTCKIFENVVQMMVKASEGIELRIVWQKMGKLQKTLHIVN